MIAQHSDQPQVPNAEACPRCGVIDRPTLMAGTGPHACKAVCGHCGRFMRWLSLLVPAERLARKAKARLEAMRKHPPSAAQLAYLQVLGDQGPAPATMAKAAERIEVLRTRNNTAPAQGRGA